VSAGGLSARQEIGPVQSKALAERNGVTMKVVRNVWNLRAWKQVTRPFWSSEGRAETSPMLTDVVPTERTESSCFNLKSTLIRSRDFPYQCLTIKVSIGRGRGCQSRSQRRMLHTRWIALRPQHRFPAGVKARPSQEAGQLWRQTSPT
jgi:hypothetical protein